jgi:hypothetical protein
MLVLIAEHVALEVNEDQPIHFPCDKSEGGFAHNIYLKRLTQ